MINLPSFGKGNPANPPSRICATGSHEWCVNRDADETGCGCVCHRADWAQAVEKLAKRTFASGETPGYCRHCHRHEWAHDGLTGTCPPEQEPDWFVVVLRAYDDVELYGPFATQERANHYGRTHLELPYEGETDESDSFAVVPRTAPMCRYAK